MVYPSKGSVLITGIEGFTGYHLSAFLKSEGFLVYGTAWSYQKENIFQLDISHSESVQKIVKEVRPDYIIHLAGISFVGHPNPLDFYKSNTIGPEVLLQALIEVGHIPKKILIPSSATVYGNQNKSTLSEEMTPLPNNHYGCSKLAMERIVANYFSRLPIIITRPFNYTGQGQSEDFLVPKIVKHFNEKSDVLELGNLHTKREFNSVKYVCAIYEKLLSTSAHSKIVNVCSNVTHSIQEILEIAQNKTNHYPEIVVNPKFVRKDEIVVLSGSTDLLESIIDLPEKLSLKSLINDMLT